MKRLTKTWISRILLLVVTCVLAGVFAQATNAQGGTEGTGTGSGTGMSDSSTGTSTSDTGDTGTATGRSEMDEATGTAGTETTDTETDIDISTGATSDDGSGTNTGREPLLWIVGALVVLGIGALLLRRRPPADTNSTL